MKKFTLMLLCCITAGNVFSQISAPGLDGKQYTPQKTQTNKKTSNDGPHDFNNSIYLNLSHAVRGIGSIGYQRIIAKNFGVRGAIGYCFAIDPTSFFLQEDNLSNYYNTKALPTYLMEDAQLQQGSNWYGDITLKYFSRLREANGSDASARWFLGMDVRRYNYLINLQDLYSSSISDNIPVSLTVKHFAYHLLAGLNGYKPGGYSWEVYTGIGIMNRKAPNFSRGEFETYYTPNSTPTSNKTIQLVLGWNVGFSF